MKKSSLVILLIPILLLTCFLAGCAQVTETSRAETAADAAITEDEGDTAVPEEATGEDASIAEDEENAADTEEAAGEDASIAWDDTLLISGTISDITEEQMLLTATDGGEYDSVLLNLTADTLLITAAYEERSTTDLSEGDAVCAYISRSMSRSIPPQSNAAVILCELGEDSSVLTYAQITQIDLSEDGNLIFTTNRDLLLIPSDDTDIATLSGETLTASQLAVGDLILASYQAMTLSLPAQANPESIRVIR